MGKKTVGKEKDETNDAEILKEKKKDKKSKKRKLELDSTEKYQDGRKKEKRSKNDEETSGVGNKERKKDKVDKKRELECDWTKKDRMRERTKDNAEASEIGIEKEKKDKMNKKRELECDRTGKDEKTTDDAEAREMGNEKEKKKKDRKKDKVNEKRELDRDWIETDKKDQRTKDDEEAIEMGNEKEKKKDKYDVEAIEVKEILNDTHVAVVGKARKNKRSKSNAEANEVSKDGQKSEMNISDMQTSDMEEKNTKIKKKKKRSDDLGVGLQEGEALKSFNVSSGVEDNNFTGEGSNANSTSRKPSERGKGANEDNGGDSNKGKKKKAKPNKEGSNAKVEKLPRTNSIENETPKRVSFSDQVEVFPSSDGPTDEENAEKDGLVRGKRFTVEEDEMIIKAVYDYIEQHDLGEEGVNMILHCRNHIEVKNCWKDIAAALPWRPPESVYYRGHILFERDENRKWTAEDYELVKNFHEKHGSDWRMLADACGKHRLHLKDTWRRIKLPNMNKGHWSQDEYQTLFDLVNQDLRMKASEVKKSKHGMLRDNISWEAISEKLSTRTNSLCCHKWYDQLTSPMVSEGIWADTDDYRLMDALVNLDACCMEDVDWDNLLEHRPGDICRKRWNQMVNHLGHLGAKSFTEQVEALSKRYCVDVLAAKEAYDSNTADE